MTVFMNLEKAYDRVLRKELWYVLHEKIGNDGKVVQLVQDVLDGSETVVRCAIKSSESFKVKVGLHQGSALSSFLLAVIMDRLTDESKERAALEDAVC